MNLLTGKVVIITGASRGIGRGIVEKFAEEGATVIFTYFSSDIKAVELENKLKSMTVIKGVQADASDYHVTQYLVKEVIKKFHKIDILVNNAGVVRDNLIIKMNKEDWDTIIRVNLNSVFNFTKAVIKPMIKQRSGSIINISSIVGIKGNIGQSNYAASKAGIIGFSKSIALELGSKNIRCNVISPGLISTDMINKLNKEKKREWIKKIPLNRLGTIEDIANVCLFLSTDLSSYITGQVLSVDGGLINI